MGNVKLNSTNGSVTLTPEDGTGNQDVTIPRAGVGKVLQVTEYEYATTITGSFANALIYSIPFVKISNTSQLLIIGSIPHAKSTNGGCGLYCTVDTDNPDNDTDAFYGLTWTYAAQSSNVHEIKKNISGVSEGSHILNIGLKSHNGANIDIGKWNPNSGHDSRISQQSTNIFIIEIGA